jgi:hypothetical protein
MTNNDHMHMSKVVGVVAVNDWLYNVPVLMDYAGMHSKLRGCQEDS